MRAFRKNRFLALTGLETASLGLYLLLMSNVFFDEQDYLGQYLTHAQDPIFAFVLIGIGLFGFIVAIFNIKKFFAYRLALASIVGIWTAYLVIFAWHDLHAPGIPIHLSSILIVFLIINLLFEWLGGD
ncbi:hypothetical protein M8332_06945 (plasmid) [Fructilactobacillus ixorae]|uniref:Uncharacterized protein n=1 Tax=Fructilactobacillus ixorae TaxID=1750535 RepID=A0ABY5C873_9LACO|nr:hypothetical protein [Fructilactobacillus ixorae]USS94018.1 hypothetical protein M8332_06945 [Fructilactobacillus ixorae]